MAKARLCSEADGMERYGMGRSKFRSWAKEIGAVLHFGRMVRYDLEICDAEIERMRKEEYPEGKRA